MSTSGDEQGPRAWMNWRAQQRGEPAEGGHETALYSDSTFTGELELGPYAILNPIAQLDRQAEGPALILRIDGHLGSPPSPPPIGPADSTSYHGGSEEEEIASLLSLSLGARVKAGGIVRFFHAEDRDPRGRPISEWRQRPLAPPVRTSAALVVPRARGERGLAGGRVEHYPTLDGPNAAALVRSARLYQDSLWICETQPHLAWVMMVSALEVAANQWRSATSASPLDQLREAKPDLVALLEPELAHSTLDAVADELADSVRVTAKFLKFLEQFWPSPPSGRPRDWARFPWKWGDARKRLNLVYAYRSSALHAGEPFPDPMCHPPERVDSEFSEVPLGLGTSTPGGSWLAKDLPLNLNTFEYITRRALLEWWDTLINEDPVGNGSGAPNFST